MHFLNIQNPISGDLPPEEQTALANAENSPVAPQVVGNGGRRRRVLRHRCPFPNCCHVDKDSDKGGEPSDDDDDDDRRSEDGEGCTEDNEEEMMESGEVTIVEQFNPTADYRAQANNDSHHHRHNHSYQHIHHHHHHHYHTLPPQLPPSQILPTVSATPKSTTLVSRGLIIEAKPSHSPPVSPCPDTNAPTSHIPQYLREKAKQYILEQLHVSERRHTKKLQLVQTWITSLEDQVYRSATTQDDYISQLAFRLAAILAQLDNSRFSSSHSLPRTCDTHPNIPRNFMSRQAP